MPSIIELNLDFECVVGDGTVGGHAVVETCLHGELPRIGERVCLCSGHDNINFLIEDYDIRVVDICHRTGGEFLTTFDCKVTMSKGGRMGGTGEKYRSCDQKKANVIRCWKNLEHLFKKRWSQERFEGHYIRTLNLS